MANKFRSGFEKKIYDSATDAGFKLDFERKDSTLRYTRIATYLPDFTLGNGILVETKGRFTAADRAKMLNVRKQNPGVDIRFVFQRSNNRLTRSPNSKTYIDWCEQHGFQWAQGEIPEEWFHENPKQT